MKLLIEKNSFTVRIAHTPKSQNSDSSTMQTLKKGTVRTAHVPKENVLVRLFDKKYILLFIDIHRLFFIHLLFFIRKNWMQQTFWEQITLKYHLM